MESMKLSKALVALAKISPGGPDQVAFVVEDLEASARQWQALGFHDWLIYTYSETTVPDLRFKDSSTPFSFRLALTGESPQIELIQPLYGQSLYSSWLDANTTGLQHLGFFVPDLAQAAEPFLEAGHDIVQQGSGYGANGDGAFAYFDLSRTEFHAILELIEVPASRRPSESFTSPRAAEV